ERPLVDGTEFRPSAEDASRGSRRLGSEAAPCQREDVAGTVKAHKTSPQMMHGDGRLEYRIDVMTVARPGAPVTTGAAKMPAGNARAGPPEAQFAKHLECDAARREVPRTETGGTNTQRRRKRPGGLTQQRPLHVAWQVREEFVDPVPEGIRMQMQA